MLTINPDLITDDMMYESMAEQVQPRSSALMDQLREDQLWGEIRRAAQTNIALQSALDHAIMIYKLSKEYKDVQSTTI